MTVIYVDAEHDLVRDDPVSAPSHRAKLDAARARLATLAGEECRAMHFSAVSPERIAQLAAGAIVLSGSTTDWARYDAAALAGLLDTIRAAPAPILGICAGHQLIGLAHGVPWGPLGALRAGEVDPDPRFAPGQRKERGFLPVEVDAVCPLFAGLGRIATFFQSHYWQLEAVPAGFAARAGSAWSAIQAVERLDRPVFGVQFHPERYDAAHPHGATVLRNFFALARKHRAGT